MKNLGSSTEGGSERKAWLRLAGIACIVFLAGCGTSSVVRQAPSEDRNGIDRDRLLTVVASCHLLRVGQAADPNVTDAAVVAASMKYGFSIDDIHQRSQSLLRGPSSSLRELARTAGPSCDRLARLTGVSPSLVRLKESGKAKEIWVRVSGEITNGLADRVIAEIRDKRAAGLVIDSPGGSVLEARRLGRYLRANGLRTAVDKSCLSACIDVLAGGVQRYVTPGAVLGIHQSKLPKGVGSHESGQAYVAGSALYLREMGVDDTLALLAAAVPHQKIFLISTANALQSRLATGVIRSL